MTEGPQPLLNLFAERKTLYYRPICYFDLSFLVRVYSLTNFINLACTYFVEFWLNSAIFKYNHEKLSRHSEHHTFFFIVLKRGRAFDNFFFQKKKSTAFDYLNIKSLTHAYESILNIWFDDTRKITLLGGTISSSITYSRVIHLS